MSKSSSAYKNLRCYSKAGTGILVFLSLEDNYKNHIRPTRGCHSDIVNELANKTASFSETERYVIVLFHEMKIQENLV